MCKFIRKQQELAFAAAAVCFPARQADVTLLARIEI